MREDRRLKQKLESDPWFADQWGLLRDTAQEQGGLSLEAVGGVIRAIEERGVNTAFHSYVGPLLRGMEAVLGMKADGDREALKDYLYQHAAHFQAACQLFLYAHANLMEDHPHRAGRVVHGVISGEWAERYKDMAEAMGDMAYLLRSLEACIAYDDSKAEDGKIHPARATHFALEGLGERQFGRLLFARPGVEGVAAAIAFIGDPLLYDTAYDRARSHNTRNPYSHESYRLGGLPSTGLPYSNPHSYDNKPWETFAGTLQSFWDKHGADITQQVNEACGRGEGRHKKG